MHKRVIWLRRNDNDKEMNKQLRIYQTVVCNFFIMFETLRLFNKTALDITAWIITYLATFTKM